jgi:hypothetical protein
MKKIAIQDANILIDLVKTGLFDPCMALQFEFSTTDIILEELYDEQISAIQPHIRSGKFALIIIPEQELTEIQSMSAVDRRLSIQDWSAFFYAQQKNALLLTGDKRLRTYAESKGIATCGIFWILDQLTAIKILTKEEACSYLEALMKNNKRLPANECNHRINLWCKK